MKVCNSNLVSSGGKLAGRKHRITRSSSKFFKVFVNARRLFLMHSGRSSSQSASLPGRPSFPSHQTSRKIIFDAMVTQAKIPSGSNLLAMALVIFRLLMASCSTFSVNQKVSDSPHH